MQAQAQTLGAVQQQMEQQRQREQQQQEAVPGLQEQAEAVLAATLATPATA